MWQQCVYLDWFGPVILIEMFFILWFCFWYKNNVIFTFFSFSKAINNYLIFCLYYRVYFKFVQPYLDMHVQVIFLKYVNTPKVITCGPSNATSYFFYGWAQIYDTLCRSDKNCLNWLTFNNECDIQWQKCVSIKKLLAFVFVSLTLPSPLSISLSPSPPSLPLLLSIYLSIYLSFLRLWVC
jgi:hypothetical protein